MTAKVFNIEVFDARTGEFSGETVRIELETYRIGFLRSRRHGDNIVATYVNHAIPARKKGHRQEIVVLRNYFYRVVPEAATLGFAGCVDVTERQLRALGFVTTIGRKAVTTV